MLGNGTVCGFVLKLAVGGDQHGGHHGKRTEGGGYHVGHDIAVVVLECPDHAALTPNDAGDRIVDQRVEVTDARRFKCRPVLCIVYLLEYQLEGLVVLL